MQLLRHPLLRVMRPADKCYLGMPSHLPALVEEEFLPQPWDGTRLWMGPGRSCHQKNLCLKASPRLRYTSRLMLQTKMQNTSVKLQTLPQRLHWMPAPLSPSSGVGNLLILKAHNAMYKATPPLLWLGLTFFLHRLCQHDAAASCGSGIPTCLPALCSDPRGWPGGKPWKIFSFISWIEYSISYSLVKCSLWLPLKTYTLHFTCIWWGEVNNRVNNNNIQFALIHTGQWQVCIFQQWIGVKLQYMFNATMNLLSSKPLLYRWNGLMQTWSWKLPQAMNQKFRIPTLSHTSMTAWWAWWSLQVFWTPLTVVPSTMLSWGAQHWPSIQNTWF